MKKGLPGRSQPETIMERITATYLIETHLQVSEAASVLAGEQSSGTFVAVPGETNELKERFAARVESIREMETLAEPSLPANLQEKSKGRTFRRAEIKVSWSIENFSFNVPAMISTLQGNLYELRQFTGLKLVDFETPPSYDKQFPGPRFGVRGTRELSGATGRPLIGTIIKPSVGLTPEETAALTASLAEAGIDFIKDDELMTSTGNSPFDRRVDAVMRVINDYALKSGKKVMYAFNITGELEEMLRRYEKVVSAGGTCVMVSVNSVGWSGVKKVCDQGALPVHGHRNGWGMLNRHPILGIEFPAYQKLWRLAGIDQIHVNGIQNKFWESDDSVERSVKACLKPYLKGETIMPVVSSGQWGGQAFETYRRTQTTDLLYLAGGAIMAHPFRPAGGVKAIQQAWTAAVQGLTLEETASKYPEFSASVEKFGKKK